MNEELRIVIRAITDEARRNIAAVREELEDVGDESSQSSKAVDTAMRGMGKSVAVAVAAITALTAAMSALGKSAQEVNKGFEKLNTTFQNAGFSAEQAGETYKQLFGFLGDHDRAIETAQSIALMADSSEDAAQWANVLKGAFAEMGDKLPIEGLAEAANETAKVGQVVGVMADALNWAGVSEDAFNQALSKTTSVEEREALILSTLNSLYGNSAKIYDATSKATRQYNESQAQLNLTLAQAAKYTTPLLTSLNQLSSTLLTYMGPALEVIAMYLTAFIQLLADAVIWVSTFFGIFSESDSKAAADLEGYNQAMKEYQESLSQAFGTTNGELDTNLDKINALKKATMGFDELNILSSPVASSSGSGSGSGGGGSSIKLPTAPNPADYGLGGIDTDFTEFNNGVKEAREKIEGLLVLIGLVGTGIGVWKIADAIEGFGNLKAAFEFENDAFKGFKGMLQEAIEEGADPEYIEELREGMEDAKKEAGKLKGQMDGIKTKMKQIGGTILIVAGAMLLLKGYTDGWANGVDWGNLALVIGGAALAVTGLYIAFGPLAATIGLLAVGVAALILGFMDFTKNGPTIQNTILIIGGAVAVAVALATAGLSVLVSVIIGATTAVAAFAAAIWLQDPAIMTVDEAMANHEQTIVDLQNAEMGYANAVDAATASAEKLAKAEEAAGMTGEELYKQVSDGTLTYGEMTDAQKELYKAYLDNEKKQRDVEQATKDLEAAKKAELLASYDTQLALAKESGSYDEFKKSVVDAFEAGELSAEEARDLISKSMSEMSDDAQKAFMEDIPDSLKDGLDPHKYETVGTKMKKWFKNTWKDIKGFFSDAGDWFAGVGKTVGEAISGAFKKVVNWILEKIETTVNIPFKMINKGIDILNNVPGIDISKLDLIEIPRLAKGGITTGSTIANIGEAGREAVLPLENNTEWMNELADRIASRSSSPSRIVLMLDGKELGWATVNSINDITKQTGSLQLVTV